MLGIQIDAALCPRLAGDARQLSLDEFLLPECRRILGGGNATGCPRWNLLGSCERRMICWTRSRNPQSGFRFPAHGSTDTGPAGRRSKNFSYAILSDTITTQSALLDSISQSFELSHKRCDEREPGTTRTARGQQTARSIKILRRLHVRSCLYPLGVFCRAVQSNLWLRGQ